MFVPVWTPSWFVLGFIGPVRDRAARSRSGPSAQAGPRGTPSTSPSDTACSRSSSWASPSSPPRWRSRHLTVAGLTIELLGDPVRRSGHRVRDVVAVLRTSGAGALTTMREGFTWGYGHLPIWAAAAAVGAGLARGDRAGDRPWGARRRAVRGMRSRSRSRSTWPGSGSSTGSRRSRTWRDGVPALATIGALLVVPLTGWGVLLGGVVVSPPCWPTSWPPAASRRPRRAAPRAA